jgi:hypothetical protein
LCRSDQRCLFGETSPTQVIRRPACSSSVGTLPARRQSMPRCSRSRHRRGFVQSRCSAVTPTSQSRSEPWTSAPWSWSAVPLGKGSGIDDEDGSRKACAYSTATAQEAIRVRTESAREVSTIGNRAPSTVPAASPLARKVRFLASMFPASRSGTTRICARPATSEQMPLIRTASEPIALSKASGPSRIPPRSARGRPSYRGRVHRPPSRCRFLLGRAHSLVAFASVD